MGEVAMYLENRWFLLQAVWLLFLRIPMMLPSQSMVAIA